MTEARYTTSRKWLARAERVIPGAPHLSGRVLTTPERSPMYFARGHGCRIADVIVTFDGLVDRAGRVVFCTSHVYDSGIMEVRAGALDGFYYSLRSIPPALEQVGRRALAAFALRQRFFHLEFFARSDGTYVALEMNVRPPGGFTTDMMNCACDFDVYTLWAAVMLGGSLKDFSYERKFFTAHAGRRHERAYEHSPEALSGQLGDTLVLVRPIPAAFASTMGNMMYLLCHLQLEPLLDAIRMVQQRAVGPVDKR